MGVDAALFALKAKRHFYYDRDYNFVPICNLSDEAQELVALTRAHAPLSAHQVRTCLVLHANDDTGCSGKAVWRAALLRFVDSHPGDTFVRHTDSEEPSWHDVARRTESVEWRDDHGVGT